MLGIPKTSSKEDRLNFEKEGREKSKNCVLFLGWYIEIKHGRKGWEMGAESIEFDDEDVGVQFDSLTEQQDGMTESSFGEDSTEDEDNSYEDFEGGFGESEGFDDFEDTDWGSEETEDESQDEDDTDWGSEEDEAEESDADLGSEEETEEGETEVSEDADVFGSLDSIDDSSEEGDTEEYTDGFEDEGTEEDSDGSYESYDSSEQEEESENIGIVDKQSDSFMDEEGNLVVMDNNIKGDAFGIVNVPIDKIGVVRRIRQGKNVDSLYQSVKSTGLLSPIVVAELSVPGMYVLIDGYRRVLACAKAGIREIPCIVNRKIKTVNIPILEAMYNQKKAYTIKEQVEYIDYLEKEKNILNPTMIEFLLQMESGDYSKLKDILNDDDDDIVGKMMSGELDIGKAFAALEKRRKKESKEEQETKRAAKVYDDAENAGTGDLTGSGETGNVEAALTDEELKNLAVTASQLDDDTDIENKTLEEMVSEGKEMPGFEPKVQDRQAGESIAPEVRKAVLTRDGGVCKCCGFGGPGFESLIDVHHLQGVANGQNDEVDGLISLCITCHMGVEEWAYGKLPVVDIDKMDDDMQRRIKKIIQIGNVKRETLIALGKKREDIKEMGKKDTQLRRMPGASQPRL